MTTSAARRRPAMPRQFRAQPTSVVRYSGDEREVSGNGVRSNGARTNNTVAPLQILAVGHYPGQGGRFNAKRLTATLALLSQHCEVTFVDATAGSLQTGSQRSNRPQRVRRTRRQRHRSLDAEVGTLTCWHVRFPSNATRQPSETRQPGDTGNSPLDSAVERFAQQLRQQEPAGRFDAVICFGGEYINLADLLSRHCNSGDAPFICDQDMLRGRIPVTTATRIASHFETASRYQSRLHRKSDTAATWQQIVESAPIHTLMSGLPDEIASIDRLFRLQRPTALTFVSADESNVYLSGTASTQQPNAGAYGIIGVTFPPVDTSVLPSYEMRTGGAIHLGNYGGWQSCLQNVISAIAATYACTDSTWPAELSTTMYGPGWQRDADPFMSLEMAGVSYGGVPADDALPELFANTRYMLALGPVTGLQQKVWDAMRFGCVPVVFRDVAEANGLDDSCAIIVDNLDDVARRIRNTSATHWTMLSNAAQTLAAERTSFSTFARGWRGAFMSVGLELPVLSTRDFDSPNPWVHDLLQPLPGALSASAEP